MTRLKYSPHALADIERLSNFLMDTAPTDAAATSDILLDGLHILKRHPLIGRQAESGMHELVISRGCSGSVALYDHDVAMDTATIIAIRQQREGLRLSVNPRCKSVVRPNYSRPAEDAHLLPHSSCHQLENSYY